MTKKATILLILIALTISLSAQDIVTIEECQRLAVAQSSANVQKEFNEQLLHVKLNDVSSHYYPTLEINGALGYISPVLELPEITPGHIDMRHDVYNATLNLQQVVFDGLQATYGRKRERLLNKTEINKLDISISKLKEQIISIYLNLLIIDKQINILSNVENTFQEKSDQLSALLKAGVVYGNSIAQLDFPSFGVQLVSALVQIS